MREYLVFSVVSRVVASGVLLWASGKHGYDYFVVLRWVVCGVSVFCSYMSHSKNIIFWSWVFGCVAVLFNPVVPVRLSRHTWTYLDVACGILLLVSIFFIKESFVKKGEPNG